MKLSDCIQTIQAAQPKTLEQAVKNTRNTLLTHLDDFEAGTITKKRFLTRSKKTLDSIYRRAYKDGSGRKNIGSDGEAWIESFKEKQFDYLDSFADAIESGATVMPTDVRMGMYADAVQSAYWAGSAIEANGMIDWVTSDVENCDDCLALEAGSPYEPDELPTVPEMGDTACRTNCKCMLVAAR